MSFFNRSYKLIIKKEGRFLIQLSNISEFKIGFMRYQDEVEPLSEI